MKKKLIRITTADISLDGLLKGQLRYMNQYYDVVALSNDTGCLHSVGEREGVRTIEVPMHREIALLPDLKCLWQLYRTFRRERPFIIHSNTPKGSLLAMIAGWLARVPHRLYTVTGLRYQGASGLFRKILMTMERLSCAFATNVIPEGEGVKRTLYADGITRKPMNVVLNGNINGIDTQHFSPAAVEATQGADARSCMRSSLGLRPEDFAFIFIGRIVGDKGMNELAAAMRRLVREQPDCKLILVGRFESELDPLQPENEAFLKESPAVCYVGYQQDVRPYLLAADALVFPSYREGFPNVVMQAGAMQLPAIVTDILGCNEIVEADRNGLLIPPRDEAALYEAMLRFLQDRPLVCDLARNARPMILSRYEQYAVWEALREEYDRL